MTNYTPSSQSFCSSIMIRRLLLQEPILLLTKCGLITLFFILSSIFAFAQELLFDAVGNDNTFTQVAGSSSFTISLNGNSVDNGVITMSPLAKAVNIAPTGALSRSTGFTVVMLISNVDVSSGGQFIALRNSANEGQGGVKLKTGTTDGSIYPTFQEDEWGTTNNCTVLFPTDKSNHVFTYSYKRVDAGGRGSAYYINDKLAGVFGGLQTNHDIGHIALGEISSATTKFLNVDMKIHRVQIYLGELTPAQVVIANNAIRSTLESARKMQRYVVNAPTAATTPVANDGKWYLVKSQRWNTETANAGPYWTVQPSGRVVPENIKYSNITQLFSLKPVGTSNVTFNDFNGKTVSLASSRINFTGTTAVGTGWTLTSNVVSGEQGFLFPGEASGLHQGSDGWSWEVGTYYSPSDHCTFFFYEYPTIDLLSVVLNDAQNTIAKSAVNVFGGFSFAAINDYQTVVDAAKATLVGLEDDQKQAINNLNAAKQTFLATRLNKQYISRDGNDANDGLSWETAKRTVPTTLIEGCEYWIGAGEYWLGSTMTIGPTNKVYGGFAGNETSPAERTKAGSMPWAYSARTLITGGAIQLFTVNGSVLDGVELTRSGSPNAPVVYVQNGGIFKSSVVRNCQTNGAAAAQGAVFLDGGNSVVDGCHIYSNDDLDQYAGGVGSVGTTYIKNSLIANNTAAHCGGGVYANGGICNIENCIIYNNQATTYEGGGIYAHNSGNLNIKNSSIVRNKSGVGGSGGGVDCAGGGTHTITNTVLWGNMQAGNHSQVDRRGTMTFINCAIQGEATGTGGINLDAGNDDINGPKFVWVTNAAGNSSSAGDWSRTNLQPKVGSPLLEIGSPTGAPTYDMIGQTRANPPTIGGYEKSVDMVIPLTHTDGWFHFTENGAGTMNGSSWENAAHGSRVADASMVAGMGVKLAGGTYTLFTRKTGVQAKVWGGFDPVTGERPKLVGGKSWEFANQTILKGPTTDGQFFDVTGGTADQFNGITFWSSLARANGGGIIETGSGTINVTDCVFRSGRTVAQASGEGNGGGALFVYQAAGNINVKNCLFEKNSTTFNGGAICHRGAALNVIGSTFVGNETTNEGGAIAVEGGTATISQSIFASNRSTSDRAAGIRFKSGSNHKVYNCLFINNESTASNSYSAAIDAEFGITVKNCTFARNKVLSAAGAGNIPGASLFIRASSTVKNCVFFGGTSTASGRENCEITTFNAGTTLTLENCAYPANAFGSTVSGTITETGTKQTISANDFVMAGGTSGALASPFVDDWRLSAGSAAIDAALEDGFTTDLSGVVNSRPSYASALPDIGAYEYQYPVVESITCTSNNIISGSGVLSFKLKLKNRNTTGKGVKVGLSYTDPANLLVSAPAHVVIAQNEQEKEVDIVYLPNGTGGNIDVSIVPITLAKNSYLETNIAPIVYTSEPVEVEPIDYTILLDKGEYTEGEFIDVKITRDGSVEPALIAITVPVTISSHSSYITPYPIDLTLALGATTVTKRVFIKDFMGDQFGGTTGTPITFNSTASHDLIKSITSASATIKDKDDTQTARKYTLTYTKNATVVSPSGGVLTYTVTPNRVMNLESSVSIAHTIFDDKGEDVSSKFIVTPLVYQDQNSAKTFTVTTKASETYNSKEYNIVFPTTAWYNTPDLSSTKFIVSNSVFVGSAKQGNGLGYDWDNATAPTDLVSIVNNSSATSISVASGTYNINTTLNVGAKTIQGGFDPNDNFTQNLSKKTVISSTNTGFLLVSITGGRLNNIRVDGSDGNDNSNRCVEHTGGTTKIENCIFIHGITTGGVTTGTALRGINSGTVEMTNTIVANSRATDAAVSFSNVVAIIDRCQFYGSDCSGDGGAVRFWAGNGNSKVINSLFVNNKSDGGAGAGSAIFMQSASTLDVINCSFINNFNKGQCVKKYDGTINITNSLFYQNGSTSDGTITYSATSASGTNIAAPTASDFVNPSVATGYQAGVYYPTLANNNWALNPTSRLINAGNNAVVTHHFDLAGKARIWNDVNAGVVDIGAYENQTIVDRLVSWSNLSAVYNGEEQKIAIVNYDGADNRLPKPAITINYTPTSVVNAGDYTVSASDATGNWNFTNTATLAITKANKEIAGIPTAKIPVRLGDKYVFSPVLDLAAGNADTVVMNATEGLPTVDGYGVTYASEGTFKVVFSSPASANYNAASDIEAIVAVTQQDVAYIVTIPSVSTNVDNGDSLADISAATGGEVRRNDAMGNVVSGTWSWAPETPTTFNYAGPLTVSRTMIFTPDVSESLSPVSKAVNFTFKTYPMTLVKAKASPTKMAYVKNESITILPDLTSKELFDYWSISATEVTEQFQATLSFAMPTMPVTVTAYSVPDLGIRYIAKTASGRQDGSSWKNAFDETKIQMAIDASGTTAVWIAEGEYKISSAEGDYGLRPKPGVSLYGGFKVGATNLENRSKTIIKREAATPNYRIVTFSQNFLNAVIDGFVFDGEGKEFSASNGGGIGVWGDNVIIRNSDIINCVLGGTFSGGGIYVNAQNTVIDNCTIKGNIVKGNYGGAVKFSNNSSNGKLINSRIVANKNGNTNNEGGAINACDVGGRTDIINCLIAHNGPNNVGNQNWGAAVAGKNETDKGRIFITNCTIVMNNSGAQETRTGVQFATVFNSILWGNEKNAKDHPGKMQGYMLSGGSNAFCSVNTFTTTGQPNITIAAAPENVAANAPQFVNPSNVLGPDGWDDTLDYRLKSTSCLINVGDGTRNATPLVDVAGNDRIYGVGNGGVIDLGAYEQTKPATRAVAYTVNAEDVTVVDAETPARMPTPFWLVRYYEQADVTFATPVFPPFKAGTYVARAEDAYNHWVGATTANLVIEKEPLNLIVNASATTVSVDGSVTFDVKLDSNGGALTTDVTPAVGWTNNSNTYTFTEQGAYVFTFTQASNSTDYKETTVVITIHVTDKEIARIAAGDVKTVVYSKTPVVANAASVNGIDAPVISYQYRKLGTVEWKNDAIKAGTYDVKITVADSGDVLGNSIIALSNVVITPKALSNTGFLGGNKVEDETSVAYPYYWGDLEEVEKGDDVRVDGSSATAKYYVNINGVAGDETSAVGAAHIVKATGIKMVGKDIANYSYDGTAQWYGDILSSNEIELINVTIAPINEADAKVKAGKVDLQWNTMEDIDVVVQYAEDKTFSQAVNAFGKTATIRDLKGLSTYYFRLNANDGYSNTVTVVTDYYSQYNNIKYPAIAWKSADTMRITQIKTPFIFNSIDGTSWIYNDSKTSYVVTAALQNRLEFSVGSGVEKLALWLDINKNGNVDVGESFTSNVNNSKAIFDLTIPNTAGDILMFRAIAYKGSLTPNFFGFHDQGVECGMAIDASLLIEASGQPTFTITLNAGPNGRFVDGTGATITSQAVQKGQTATIRIQANEKYSLENVINNGAQGRIAYEFNITNVQGNRTISATFTDFPTIFVNTPNDQPVTSKEVYLPAEVIVEQNRMTRAGEASRVYKKDGDKVQIKGRGNSTWSYSKKPYRLKFDKNNVATWFDMNRGPDGKPIKGGGRNWILLANWIDPTDMRNDVAYEIGRRLEVPFTKRTQHVRMIFNGRYDGLYQLCEHNEVRANCADIGSSDWYSEFDTYSDEYIWNTPRYRFPQKFKQPELGGLVPTSEEEATLKPAKDQITAFENALKDNTAFERPDLGYEKYINDESFIDWLIVHMIAGNYEPKHPKSTYFHINTKEGSFDCGTGKPAKWTNGKITAGNLWDFDWAYGYGGNEGQYTTLRDCMWFGDLFKYPKFQSKFKKRWEEVWNMLEAPTDGKTNLYAYIQNKGNEIRAEQLKDYARWNQSGGKTPEENNQALINWIKNNKNTYSTEINKLVPTSYSISVGTQTNCTISVPSTGVIGDSIIVLVTPSANYTVSEVSYTLGVETKIIPLIGGKYEFMMPNDATIISASAKSTPLFNVSNNQYVYDMSEKSATITPTENFPYTVKYHPETPKNAGVYDILVTVNDPSYHHAVDSKIGELVITPVAATVTADNKAIEFREDAPAFTSSVSGFLAGDADTVLYTLTTSYTNQSPIGNYDIIVNITHVSPNYTVTAVKGVLSVEMGTPHVVNVIHGSGSGNYSQWEDVTVTAAIPNGYLFIAWKSDDITITNPHATTFTFTMPDKAVRIEADSVLEKGVRYVTTTGSGGKTGHSWADAADILSLATLFNQADTVLVAGGTYNILSTLTIPSAKTLVGGVNQATDSYQVGADSWDIKNPTIFDGASGTGYIVNLSGKIEGVTVTNGHGGIRLNQASTGASVINCIVLNNQSTEVAGAGIDIGRNDISAFNVIGCLIKDNMLTSNESEYYEESAGGLSVSSFGGHGSSYGVIKASSIIGNSAQKGTGGLYLGRPTGIIQVVDCIVAQNTSSNGTNIASGIGAHSSTAVSNLLISKTTIVKNSNTSSTTIAQINIGTIKNVVVWGKAGTQVSSACILTNCAVQATNDDDAAELISGENATNSFYLHSRNDHAFGPRFMGEGGLVPTDSSLIDSKYNLGSRSILINRGS